MTSISKRHCLIGWGLMAVVMTLAMSRELHGQGITVAGVGPVNRSMGSAGTAAPLEAIGALHWNPGSISALPVSQVSFGMEGLLADIELSSTVSGVTNKTSGEPGVAPIPAVGWVHHLEGTPTTIGLGMYGIAGFRNSMPRDPNNPLLANGPLFADAEILQIAPTLSYALSPRLSVGIAPTVSAARLMFDPLGPSVITPAATAGTGNRVHWGAGVQVGVYYVREDCWHIGFTVKSPQWFEDLRFFTSSGVTTLAFEYPMIVSLGFAYSGLEDWVFAADFRYFDYANSDGFSEFGWSNVFAAAFGVQRRLNECWHLRCGYSMNQNPLHASDAITNISDPLIQEHNLAAGASYRLARNVDLSMAYIYLANNSLTGPLPAPFAAGDTLTHEIEAHSLAAGVTVRY